MIAHHGVLTAASDSSLQFVLHSSFAFFKQHIIREMSAKIAEAEEYLKAGDKAYVWW